MFWIPMAIGAAAGALQNKDNPLKGAAIGAGLGAAGGAGLGAMGAAGGAGAAGGLGGLGGTAASATGAASGGLGLSSGAAGLGLQAPGAASLSSMGGAQGLLASAGPGTSLTAANAAAPASEGLLSAGNMKTMTDVAGLAQKAGVFGNQQAPQAQSAGIPARQPDFTGLLSSGGQGQMSGAQRLMQQRQAARRV